MSKQILLNVIGGVLVVAIIIGILLSRSHSASTGRTITYTLPQVTQTAPSGQSVNSEIASFVVAKDAVIEKSQSFTTKSPSGVNITVLTVQYHSSLRLEALFENYKNYAASNGFIIEQSSLTKTGATMRISKSGQPSLIAVISISDTGETRGVTVSINKQ